MSADIELDKKNLKDFLIKREVINEKQINYISIPYSVNFFSNGIEQFFNKTITISTSNKNLLCYHPVKSNKIKIYNPDEAQILELNFDSRKKSSHGLEYIYQTVIELSKEKFNDSFYGAIKDDLYFIPNYSISVKVISTLYALYKINNIKFNSNSLVQLLNSANNKLISTKLNIYEVLGFISDIKHQNIPISEKLNCSELKNYKLLQIFFNSKSGYKSTKIEAELAKALNLINALLASKKLNDISEIDKDEMKTFVKRLPDNQQKSLIFLYNKSSFINQSINALRGKNIGEFIEIINQSGKCTDFLDDQLLSFSEKLKYIKELIGLTFSALDNNIICLIEKDDEEKILFELNKISQNLYINTSFIENLFIFKKN